MLSLSSLPRIRASSTVNLSIGRADDSANNSTQEEGNPMKRIVTLLLAAGLVLGAAGAGNAADVKVKGAYDFAIGWSNSFRKDPNADNFKALQRLRTQVDFIASESLKGVVFIEIGDQNWGKAAQGASLGTDGTVIEVRYSYIDWVVPNTDLKVRMGLQPVAFPGYVANSTVLNHDGAGITLNYDFNENVAASLFWARLENDNARAGEKDNLRHDAFDLFGLTVPLTFDGVRVTPWGAYARIGRHALEGAEGGHADGNGTQFAGLKLGMMPMGADFIVEPSNDSAGNAWWLGVTGDITLWNPFRLAFDFNYGAVDMGTVKAWDENGVLRNGDLERKGWVAALLAEYKLDFATPGLIFWYGSGDDSNPYDGSERLPSMRPAWSPTPYGFDGYVIDTGEMLGTSAAGTWGVVARLNDISFREDLSHVLRVGYYRGTNDKKMAEFVQGPYNGYTSANWQHTSYLTEKDCAWEVDFDTTYKIYEDLSLRFALGYIYLDLSRSAWGDDVVDNTNKNNLKAFMNMQYTF